MLCSSYTSFKYRLLALSSRVDLGSEVCCSRATGGEESGKDWLNNRLEDDLSAASDWEGHPEDEDKLEGVVECCQTASVTRAGWGMEQADSYGTSIQR